jgi:hypothetical protein
MNRVVRAGRRPAAPAGRKAPARRLAFEQLEDRTLPAPLLSLVSPANTMLPACDGVGGVQAPMNSADGRFTAYATIAANVVAGQVDSTLATNVFLHDQQTGTTTLISHTPGSLTTGADGDSDTPRISGDGRFIAYTSLATNLVPGQSGPPGQTNVFLYDRTTGTNTLVSHRFDSATTTGNYGSYTSNTTGFGFNINPGRFLLYDSVATDLVAGHNGPTVHNLFLYDTTAGTTTLVSHSAASPLTAANMDVGYADLTPDGSAIVYESYASDVVDHETGPGDNIILFDRTSGQNQLISGVFTGSGNSATEGAGRSIQPSISTDGRIIAYLSDSPNHVADQQYGGGGYSVFSYDTLLGTTSLVSGADSSPTLTGNGNATEAVVSGDGSRIAFFSDATNLVPGQGNSVRNVFLYHTDRPTDGLALVTHVNDSPTTAAGLTVTNVTGTFDDLCVSADGRFVAYVSIAGNLTAAPTDTTGLFKVFVYDSQTGANTLASHVNGSPAVAGNQNSYWIRLSADGSAIAFLSEATDLVPGLTIGDTAANLYRLNLTTGDGPALVSRSAFRANVTSVVYGTSGDGRFVLYTSNATNVVPNQVDTNFGPDIFLLDRDTGTTTLVSHTPAGPAVAGNRGSPTASGVFGNFRPVLSGDGNFVAFVSQADDLVPNESGPQGKNQVFLFNRLTGAVTLVSHRFDSPSTRSEANSDDPVLSADGQFIAYRSHSSDLVQGFMGPPGLLITNVFLYDTVTGKTTLVSHDANNPLQNAEGVSPVISDDGRFVAYSSVATNIVAGGGITNTSNIYLFDRTSGSNTLVNHVASSATTSPTVSSTAPVISTDGNYVAFVSFATDLVDGLTDSGVTNVFLFSRQTGTVTLVSRSSGPDPANGYSDSPALNQDGSLVAFRSTATNLIANQVGGGSNIYLFSRQTATPTLTLVSHKVGADTTAAAGDATVPVIDGDGSLLTYLSTASDLVPGQTGGGVNNVFGYARRRGLNFLVSGLDGSTTTPSPAPTFQPVLSRHSISAFAGGGGLVQGAAGTTNVYVNALLRISFTADPLAIGNPVPTRAGTLTVDSALKGQYRPADVALPGGQAADNDKFQFLDVVALDGTVPLWTRVVVGQTSFAVLVQVDPGFGDPVPVPLTLAATPPPLTVTITRAANQTDPGGGPVIHFTVVFSRPVGDFTAADVSLSGMAGLTAAVSGSGTTYDVAVRGMAGAGPVTAWVGGGVAHDGFGTANQAAPALAGVTYDPTAPPGPLYSVAQAFSRSREHYVDFLGKAYRQYLKREPDAGGLNFWVGALLAGTYSDEQVEAFFIGSDEYINVRYHGDRAAWVQGMYQDLLLRPASAAEVALWLQALAAGTTESAVALGFAASPEREQLRIADSYRTFLGREPNQGEVNLWLDAFEHGLSNEDLVAGFVGSKEYYLNPQKGQDDPATWARQAYLDVLARPAADSEVALWLGVLGG